MNKPAKKPDRLLPALQRFVREYDSNGGNGVRAWLASHPETKSRAAAAQSAYLTLRNPEIRARLEALQQDRWTRLQMTGDEALYLVACDARADIRELYDESGHLLPVEQWPDDVAHAVKSVRRTADSTVVVLNDKLTARRLILEQQGKLKGAFGGLGELARLLGGEPSEAEERPDAGE